MEGKISVIVPIYNQERYLNKSISSIINQKYTNLEIILINDGSTDSSIEIIDDFALKDSRIRVFSKPNGGLVDATIYGINQATGEYIAFLDPDDYIGPLYLWDLLSQMDDDIDFVASGFYRNNNGQFIPVILSEDSKIVGDQFQKLREHYLLDGKIDFSDKIFISRWNKLYRANVVKTVAAPFFNYREVTLGEDSIFTYLMLSHSRGCKTIKGPKDYFYNVGNQNSMMVSNTIERHMEKSKLAYNSLKNLLINEGLSTKQAYALYFFEVESVFERLMKTDFEQFRKFYYHLRKDEVYTTSLKLFRDLSYSAKTWIRIFGRLYFPAFLYSYIRLKLKSDLRTIKLFLGNTRFILKYLVKNGLVKTHYQIKFRRRRDNNFKEINKFLPIIDSRVKEIITSYTGGKTELNECPVCNNIFLFWWDGFDTAPELVKACTETVYKYYPDCAIHLIDKNNYRKFTDIDNIILTDFEKGKISIQVFSDILRFAYACSFGTVSKHNKHPEYVIDGIKDLNYISVRDENSADIVEEITGVRPPVVLDPTWLWNFSNDNNIIKPKFDNYIIVYGVLFTKEFINQTIEYSHKKGYKLICLACNDDKYDWCDVLIQQSELSVFEWLGLFKYAEKVVTSTYHGLMFGLIFNKPLAFCKSDFIVAKAESFLKKIGLYDLYVTECSSVEKMLGLEWDYQTINHIIEIERNKSMLFLHKALKGD